MKTFITAIILLSAFASFSAQACDWQLYASVGSDNRLDGPQRNPGTTTFVCRNIVTQENHEITVPYSLHQNSREKEGRAKCKELCED